MSRPNFARITQVYRDAHPEVDWATNQVYYSRDENGDWYASGHHERNPELEAIAERLCCDGTCGMHSGAGEQRP